MTRNVTVSPDGFAAALEDILNDIDYDCAEAIEAPVKEAAKSGRDQLREVQDPRMTGEYAQGWSFTTKGKAKSVFAEIGNKRKPGLAHLLEKGHAKVGGGRVPSHPHIDPVAQKVFDELEESVSKAIGGAL